MNKEQIEKLIALIKEADNVKNTKGGLDAWIGLAAMIVQNAPYVIYLLEEDIKINAEVDKFFGGKDEQ